MLAINLVAGKILSSYDSFNILANSIVIIVNVILLWFVDVIHMKEGFRVSLSCLFPFLGVIEYLCFIFCDSQLENNGIVIFVMLLILLQIVLLVIADQVSRSIQ